MRDGPTKSEIGGLLFAAVLVILMVVSWAKEFQP